jgi:predicted transposase YdaD
LAEKYPDRFASWLLGREITGTKVFKTELSLEPIRADSVTFLRLADRILHLEFQVKVPQNKSMPLRMLNYWVRLYWQHNLPITQVLIWLKETNNPAVLETQFQLESVRCGFQVVRMWEQPPELLLQNRALLPLAVLCQSENPTGLLSQVASEVAKIEQPEEREEIIGSTQLLAGLRFEADLIRNLFQGGLMRESTVFQEILQEGRDEGKQEQALATIYRLLPRRIGTVAPELQQRLLQLSLPQLEDLTEALLDFSRPEDLIAWLDRVEAIRIEVLRKGRLTTIDRLLPRRIGTVAPELQQRLLELSLPQLEDLTEALLDFEEPNDLIAWLDALPDS